MSYLAKLRHKKDYHTIPDFYEKRGEMIKWCEGHFGDYGNNWALYMNVWRFRYKKDFSHFLLRWT
jgi:hypothetical protein